MHSRAVYSYSPNSILRLFLEKSSNLAHISALFKTHTRPNYSKEGQETIITSYEVRAINYVTSILCDSSRENHLRLFTSFAGKSPLSLLAVMSLQGFFVEQKLWPLLSTLLWLKLPLNPASGHLPLHLKQFNSVKSPFINFPFKSSRKTSP